MADGKERKGLVFYYEWMDQIAMLPQEMQLEVIWAIFNYDKDDKKVKTDNPLLAMALEKYYYEIDQQRDHWEQKAGRPVKYDNEEFFDFFNEGMTNDQVKDIIGCSLRTVQRRRKEFNDLVKEDEERYNSRKL